MVIRDNRSRDNEGRLFLKSFVLCNSFTVCSFPFQDKPKGLDPSCKTGLDYRIVLEGENLHLITEEV